MQGGSCKFGSIGGELAMVARWLSLQAQQEGARGGVAYRPGGGGHAKWRALYAHEKRKPPLARGIRHAATRASRTQTAANVKVLERPQPRIHHRVVGQSSWTASHARRHSPASVRR